MAGGGGVEDDVVVICWGGEEFGELVKGGDFDGAGAGELFLHAGEGGGREDAAVGADDAFAIGEGGGFGIDVAGFQLGQAGDGGGGVVVVVIAVAVAWIKDSTQLPRTLVDLELLLMFDYYCD